MALAKKVVIQTGAIREFEKPKVSEAIKVANANKWTVCLSPTEWDERKARLKKELEKHSNAPMPGPGEEQPKEGDLKAATKMFGAQAREIMRLTAENAELRETIDKMKEGNPALKEALNESASQFNDALLNEQGKKIKRLGKEIARLNKIIHKKNLKIEELGKESSRHLEGKMKMFGENFDLEQELKDKNAVLSDVAEELRLSKIREKNLTEVCQKYVKEIEDLRENLAEKTNLVEIVRKGSKEYCEYGIAAEKMIQKMAKDIVNDRPVSPKDYEQYRHWAKGYRFNPQLPERTDEEEKKPNTSKSALDDLKEKAYNSFNAKAHNLGLVGSKDGNGIIDQMVGVDIAEEGADQSAIIAQCYKNIAISKDEAEIIERCTKNGTELHYSEKDGFTYTNMFGDEMPIICLRGMCQVFTDEEIKNMKK